MKKAQPKKMRARSANVIIDGVKVRVYRPPHPDAKRARAIQEAVQAVLAKG